MANQWFDRTPIFQREKPLSSDINGLQSQIDRTLRDLALHINAPRVSTTDDRASAAAAIDGFVNSGFKVRPTSPASMRVTIDAGFGWQYVPGDVPAAITTPPGISNLSDLSVYKPLVLAGFAFFDLNPAPAAPNDRIDIIEAKYTRRLENLTSRNIWDTVLKLFTPQNVPKTLAFDLQGQTGTVIAPNPSTAGLSYVVGVPGNPPAAPATTPGYLKLAQIRVNNGVLSVSNQVIQDSRRRPLPGSLAFTLKGSVQNVGAVPLLYVTEHTLPPGWRIAAYGTSVNPAAGRIYVIGGDMTGVRWAVAPQGYVWAAGKVSFPYEMGTSVVGTISGPEQVILVAGSNGDAIDVAVGQSCLRIDLQWYSIDNGGVVGNLVLAPADASSYEVAIGLRRQ